MAVLEQERHVELVSGASEAFVITTRMKSALTSELPHLNIFVITVNDVVDPKQDTLARVARIADLTTLPVGRDAGIASPSIEGTVYLAASTTNVYDTVETANNAATAFQDRVNALIEAWILFTTDFNAPDPSPELITLPRSTATQKSALIEAYKVAKQDRYTKQTAKAEADAALTRAQTDYTSKQGLATALASLATAAPTNQSEMVAVLTGLSNLLAASNSFLVSASAEPPSASDKATFQAAITLATQVQSASSGYVGDAATLTGLVTSYRDARTTDAGAAGTALALAQADQLTKAQQLTSALAIESAALTAVLAVCPDFDKHSIAFVDDNGP